MLIGISGMAWDEDQNDQMVEVVENLGYDYIEAVYSRIPVCNDIYSIQGIFYNSGAHSFDDVRECYQRIDEIVDLCINKNIKIITVGSPSMRKRKKDGFIKVMEYFEQALQGSNIIACIEPNARFYGAEYYYNIGEIVRDISAYSNVKTMIDTGSILMEWSSPLIELDKYFEYIKHVHFSAPFLRPIEDFTLYHEFMEKLKSNGYNGGVTYEVGSGFDPVPLSQKFADKVFL